MKRTGLCGFPVTLAVAGIVAMAALWSGCSDDSATGNENNNVPPGCGNGIVEPDLGEACDDGSANSDIEPNACRVACQFPSCGDDVRDSGEDCDGDDLDGSICADLPFLNHGTLRCTLDCTFDTDECYQCGDGTIDPGEECDIDDLGEVDYEPANCGNVTGKPDGELACQTDCMYDISECALCGDGLIEGPEECDDASDNSDQPNATCRLNCSISICGDGIQDDNAPRFEGCDCGTDPLALPFGCLTINIDNVPNACKAGCVAPFCGDGLEDDNEECDDGTALNCPAPGDPPVPGCTCAYNCTQIYCGNGALDPGEACDCGDDFGSLGPSCTVPNCNSGPECECANNCEFPACGNGAIEPYLNGETCDDGSFNCDNIGCACGTACRIPGCGNGIPEAYLGEECDEGFSNCDIQNCSCGVTCLVPRCGNGYPDFGEECDCGDNAQQQTCTRMNCEDASNCECTTNCLLPRCGNGVLETYAGEGCDEGDGNNCDVTGCTCTTTCALPWIVERQPQGSQEHLTAVWTDGTVAWAVGFSGTVLHRNSAGDWTPAASPAFTTLRAIWADSENSVLVVGDNRTMLRYSGTIWQDDSGTLDSVIPATMNFTGVECWNLVARECAISCSDGSIVIPSEPGPFQLAWTNSSPYTTTTYNAIAVDIPFTGPYLLAVGDQGTWLPAYPWDTPGWSPDHQNLTVDNLEAIWLGSIGNGWVVGEAGTIFHGIGGIWTTHNSNTGQTLWDVVGIATEAYAVGDQGTIRRYPGSGVDWASETGLHTQALRGVAAAGGLVLAVGDDGIILRRP